MAELFVSEIVWRAAAAGEEPLIWSQDRATTGAEFGESIFRYARALAGSGIGGNDLVGLFAPNRPEALAIRYAANLIGAATCFLPSAGTAANRHDLLTMMDLRMLVVFPETAHLVPDPAPAGLACVGVDLPGIRLDRLAAAESGDPLPCRARPHDLGHVASSGGTTGVPKGSLRSFEIYSKMVATPEDPTRRQLVNGPLAYLSQTLVDSTILGGGTVIMQDAFDPAETLAAIEAHRVTHLMLLETQLAQVIDHPDLGIRDLSSLRILSHGGAAAPPSFRRRAREAIGPVLATMYGCNELGMVSFLAPGEYDRPEHRTSVGRISPGVDVRIRAADGTIASVPGGIGTIEVRSPQMAQGYRNQPEREAAAFVDGWYHTGDLGAIGENGVLYFHGRADDLSNLDGAQVTSDVLEDTAARVPGVRYAVAVADEDGTWSVAIQSDTAAVETCRHAITTAHGITAVVARLTEFPLTEQGKADRVAIRTLVRSAQTARPGQAAAGQ